MIAALEADVSRSGDALVAANHAHREAMRRALLAGDPNTALVEVEAVEAARRAHDHNTLLLTEARRMLVEAEQRERDQHDAELREAIRVETSRITIAANDADMAFATFVGALRTGARVETDLRLKAERELGRAPTGGATMGAAIEDAITHLQALRNGIAGEVRGFTSERASIGVRRILGGIGGA